VSADKLARVASTLERLHLREGVELLETSAGEALGERTFDAVLVDAPCTNTGVLAQRPEARWRFGPASKAELTAIQTRLFERAAQLVRPGGRLVWSTCALEPDENRRAVDTFLAQHGEFQLELDAEALPDLETTQSAGAGPIDGGYFARLRRTR
jgi:16S rRNA (cytosine967-C5)-methyltransferase